MIKEIGDIVIDKLVTLPWVDKYAGVVKNISFSQEDKNQKVVKKTMPVACKTTWTECESGQYVDLVPDSSKKSVMYLEDNGIRFVKKEGDRYHWRASMNLVVWLNMARLGFTDCTYSSVAITGILSKLPITPFHSGLYQFVQINAVGQQPSSQNPFQKYSYDETVLQFLMYPFDYFVLLLEVEFVTNKRCLEVMPIGEPINCK